VFYTDLVEVDKEGAQRKVDDTPYDGEAEGEVLVGRNDRAQVQHLQPDTTARPDTAAFVDLCMLQAHCLFRHSNGRRSGA
jgi:hypothetical protein